MIYRKIKYPESVECHIRLNQLRCDEVFHCRDLSDEIGCDEPKEEFVSESLFVCCDGVQMISAAKQCNGFSDCKDGSDEFYCKERKFIFNNCSL